MKVILTMIILSIALISCRKPENEPELRDPIYIDMKNRLSFFERELKNAYDEKKSLESELQTLSPQTGAYKARVKELYSAEKKINTNEQKVIYFKMAIDSQRKKARLAYLNFYKENRESEWPDPNEFARYKSRVENTNYLKAVE